MSDRRPRRMATPAERQQAREVATFVESTGLADRPVLITLTLICKYFPDITLETALVGWVGRRLLLPSDLRLPADIADLEPWGHA